MVLPCCSASSTFQLELEPPFRLILSFYLDQFSGGRSLNKPHKHLHAHGHGDAHGHDHNHNDDHKHVHLEAGKRKFTPWVLFTIFLLGPCEPLIPVLMYPAANNNFVDLAIVIGIFGAVTISLMLGIVLISTFGINLIPTEKIERFTHAIAGGTILLSGLAIQFLGL